MTQTQPSTTQGFLGKIFSAIFGGDAQASQSSPAATGVAPMALANANTNQNIDVAKILDEKSTQQSQKLNWKTSIVDLLKLLDLDSSIEARKTLAKELNYTGDTSDSASMNTWLHKQVMQKLAANGGKLPADLAA